MRNVSNARRILAAVLMVPIVTTAGLISVRLAKAWNDWVGAGGAIVVGLIASGVYLLILREPADD